MGRKTAATDGELPMSCWHLTMEIGLQPTSSPTTALADGAVQMASLRAAISCGWPSWIHVGSQGCNADITGSMICSMYNRLRGDLNLMMSLTSVINHTYGFILASCRGAYCAEGFLPACSYCTNWMVTKEAFKK